MLTPLGSLSKLLGQIRTLQQRLEQPLDSATSLDVRGKLDNLQEKHSKLDDDIAGIVQRIHSRCDGIDDIAKKVSDQSGNQKMPHESQRDFLIRTGKITPFSKVASGLQRSGTLQEAMLDAEEEAEGNEVDGVMYSADQPKSHQYLSEPGFAGSEESADTNTAEAESERQSKRRKVSSGSSAVVEQAPLGGAGHQHSADSGDGVRRSKRLALPPGSLAATGEATSASNSVLESEFSSEPASSEEKKRKRPASSKSNKKKSPGDESQKEDLRDVDDGNEKLYQARLKDWVSKRREARTKAIQARRLAEQTATGTVQSAEQGNRDEWLMPHPMIPDTVLESGLRLPGDIYQSLFDYQKTGVQWLWELYQQNVGGIIGDEMGLGKTIQVISFLAGLHHSNMLKRPVIVVTPATVMKQWVNEFHRWWPPLRVSILHTSGSGMLYVQDENEMEEEMELEDPRTLGSSRKLQAREKALKILNTVERKGHVLITTYAGLQSYGSLLVPVHWGYAVLDEGHKIRNPNAAVTIYCKELQTANRIILSGTPMQNNLTELWSLFDFIYPMRLGTLLNFRAQFEIPIKMGGYANASHLQVQTASKCAETLKDAISPYLLQRLKVDVASDLPRKSEQVLFCKLTPLQRLDYREYLDSEDVRSIMDGNLKAFSGIEKLRKICNHPDLLNRDVLKKQKGYSYGDPSKSGKMQVVKALLDLWKKNGHKALIFAQQKIMLNILEDFVKSLGQFNYRRMDGETPIQERQNLVDEFNSRPDIDLFLLTTKVGGLGVNLTGADRVIIFDPDWNPSTDTQARERAWRLGQKKEVTIYRLMTAGTIEEKIYHRQLFKQFLANKILKDPSQRQTIPLRDLRDLFTLGEEGDESETGQLFRDAKVELGEQPPSDGNVPQRSHEERVVAASGGDGTNDLQGLARVEELVDPGEEEAKRTGSDDRIVEGILATSGVSSAVEHDQIVNGKRVIQADPAMIAQEARRIAAEAAKQLKKAAEAARHVPIGVPTWTGQVGVTGRPGGVRGGPSSSSVLARLQGRQSTMGAGGGGVTPNGQLRGNRWVEKIRTYIMSHGGEVRSQMLVDHFGHMCKNGQQSDEFRNTLRMMATLEKGSQLRGKWVLKDEYKK